MTIRDWFNRITGRRAAPASAGASLSGRPGYASTIASLGTVPRTEKFELLSQFYGAIPPLKRAVSVLSGMIGSPEVVTSTEADTREMETWLGSVRYGRIGRGLGMYLRDHARQTLLYGFGVGEAETLEREVVALHSYSSPRHGFRSDPRGEIEILQYQAGRGLTTLNPETTVLSVHDPDGGNPNGESLFFAIPTVAQTWLEILHNYRETWRRCGSPVFHVNWEPHQEFNDPNGTTSATIRAALESAWNAIIKSKVVDGKTKDFFSTGKVSVTTIGADGQVLDVQLGKRNIVEEIVVATHLPPWLLGYSWSTTERLSQQQADMLVSFIEVLREEFTGGLRELIELRRRLAGKRGEFELVWPEVNLQDLTEQARAELVRAQAQRIYQAYLRQLWADGVIEQEDYAELLTESRDVVIHYEQPQPLAGGSGGSADDGASTNAVRALPATLRELREEYREVFRHTCNGRHS